ncbi:hypothetical protein CR513_62817, partial [Mucuna pruriens]
MEPYPGQLLGTGYGLLRWDSRSPCAFASLLGPNIHKWGKLRPQLQVALEHLTGCGNAIQIVKRMEVVDLFEIKQMKGENLKGYLTKFNNVTVWVNNPDQKLFVKAF